jgi:hypothetical protein
MLDVILMEQEGLLSQLDLYIFRGQLFPGKGRWPMLAKASFKIFLSRFFCRSIFTAEDKEKYIQLQPFYDEVDVDVDDDAPEPITDISMMVFMTDQEFEELPDWWDVEDSPQFNTQFRKPPPEWFKRPDSGDGDWAEKDLNYQTALDEIHKRKMQGVKALVKNKDSMAYRNTRMWRMTRNTTSVARSFLGMCTGSPSMKKTGLTVSGLTYPHQQTKLLAEGWSPNQLPRASSSC